MLELNKHLLLWRHGRGRSFSLLLLLAK